ncbi:MAG: ABC transporter ATP-binding protein [Anderseniella sp.]|jgi:ABC-type multidrug transport system fused ATPase/permease subunit|nr:ABC transporter ATP-binding protein [Anderseniella sp.]
MLRVWRQALNCLTALERKQSLGVLALMIVMAMFEVVGIASVLPFLAVLGDPGLIERQPMLAWAYASGGFSGPEPFLLALGLAAFVLLVLAAIMRSVTLYVLYRFIQMRRHTLSCRLLEGYLGQPYEFFLNRHTGDMGKNILSEVDVFVNRALLNMGQVVASGLVLVAMVTFLLIVDPVTAAIVAVVLGAFYMIAYGLVRGALGRSGQARAVANRTRFETAAEALGGVKTLKILGREGAYFRRFADGSEILARNEALSIILGLLPKNAIETIAFGGIILAAMAMMWQQGLDGILSNLLPMLSLYAFAGYRMLPAMQTIYNSATGLRFATASVDTIVQELETIDRGRDTPAAQTALPLNQALELRNIGYVYPGSTAGLRDVSLTLRKGKSLGIVGRTGSGKTTLVDLILGLLVPQQGTVLVDGTPLDDHSRRAWQKSIGYVPQDIFLSDATLAQNIALGLPVDKIDQTKVEHAARIARIHDFVVDSLPDGYATRVGERGVRLSGGQRQRVGIARALYHDPELIVFDEATSALDTLTETEVMEALRALAGVKTIILIAHRTSTLEACDQVVRLEGGKILNITQTDRDTIPVSA